MPLSDFSLQSLVAGLALYLQVGKFDDSFQINNSTESTRAASFEVDFGFNLPLCWANPSWELVPAFRIPCAYSGLHGAGCRSVSFILPQFIFLLAAFIWFALQFDCSESRIKQIEGGGDCAMDHGVLEPRAGLFHLYYLSLNEFFWQNFLEQKRMASYVFIKIFCPALPDLKLVIKWSILKHIPSLNLHNNICYNNIPN